jgi:hypothetical protein
MFVVGNDVIAPRHSVSVEVQYRSPHRDGGLGMRMSTSRSLVWGVAVASLVAAGCGSDGDSSQSSATASLAATTEAPVATEEPTATDAPATTEAPTASR